MIKDVVRHGFGSNASFPLLVVTHGFNTDQNIVTGEVIDFSVILTKSKPFSVQITQSTTFTTER